MAAALGISSGDPAGIGPEIICKSWERRRAADLPLFFAIGEVRAFSAVWDGPIRAIGDLDEVEAAFPTHLPVLSTQTNAEIRPAQPTPQTAQSAFQALETAIGLARNGSSMGVVTGPVSKAQLQLVGFTHPGQTEFIAERCGVAKQNAAMMLAGPTLRVVPITVHEALRDVPDLLSVELIVARALSAAKGLQRNFGIARPRLAIAGLNPHAGESSLMGREEEDIILPAVVQIRELGLNIMGPLSADIMFHESARSRYDVALCPYHDQALIPLKTLHFWDGVNITLGLPIVRTSPDHGTAFDIAGRDIADPRSMIAAIRMAAEAYGHRQAHDG